MSWPIILVCVAVGFVLGALWHRAHAADVKRRHGDRIEVQYPLPVQRLDRSTEYRLGRRGREKVTR
ncbi:MAG: hypothetical protein ABUJ98_14545 [Hyphomicrobium sp.]